MKIKAAVVALLALAACGGDDTASTGDASGVGPEASAGDGSGEGAADAAPSCGTNAWLTYGHDSRRTFTSDACIKGNLKKKWTYTPAPPMGRTSKAFNRAIAQSDAVFLQWAASDDPYTGTTAADRVSIDGMRVWTFDSGSDSNLKFWPTFAFGSLFLDDDGVYVLDGATGKKTATTGVDRWGQIAFDDTRLYASNCLKLDGPGLEVWAFGTDTKPIWQKNTYAKCGEAEGEIAGGTALDGGVLFTTASYVFQAKPAPLASGVYALDAVTGAQKWFKPYTPTSSISAGEGKVYFIDSSATLFALSETDGSVAWSQPVMSSANQAPVLIDNKIVIMSQGSLVSFSSAGKAGWKTMVPSASFVSPTSALSNNCSGGQYPNQETTIAGAGGSHTLVVTTGTGLAVFSALDGTLAWSDATLGALHDPVVTGTRVYALGAMGLVAFE